METKLLDSALFGGGGWVGGSVGGMEENEAVRMRCCGGGLGGRVDG